MNEQGLAVIACRIVTGRERIKKVCALVNVKVDYGGMAIIRNMCTRVSSVEVMLVESSLLRRIPRKLPQFAHSVGFVGKIPGFRIGCQMNVECEKI